MRGGWEDTGISLRPRGPDAIGDQVQKMGRGLRSRDTWNGGTRRMKECWVGRPDR